MSALEAAECPQCGAGVRVPPGQLRVDCPYCHTTLFVRDGLLHVVHHRGRALVVGAFGSVLVLAAVLAFVLWPATRVQGAVQPVVVPVAPLPVAQPVPSLTNPEPDFLNDPEAMAGLLGRVRGATDATGRFRYLSVTADRTSVALVEVGPRQIDSIAMTWGHTIVKPVPLTDEEQARLDTELFELSVGQLREVPALVGRTLEASPDGTSVERVDLLGIAGPPRIEIHLSHPREVLEPVRLDLLSGAALTP
ncbi:MAG: hypothetical protein R3F61_14995 [Myxococcota bacterium]